ncbi:hypothetical protein [Acidovorax sp. Leaf73]|uniref:hypothetical protein n=1 Tax=Acidovorax sp. Leaf73 TaxID=2876566 RepID=UPI001E4F64CE|nr:hypothetical protein [Acidovorax sp. Leaf73]
MTKDVIELAREAGMKFAPAQFSGVLETETDEFTVASFAALVAARERERLNFLCSTDRMRMIEHIEGLWRVYQDEAPAEAEHQHWQAMTSIYYTTPESAIDAAIRALNTEGEGHDRPST